MTRRFWPDALLHWCRTYAHWPDASCHSAWEKLTFGGAVSSIDMYNNDVGKKSAQKIMKQTGDLKAATLYFAS